MLNLNPKLLPHHMWARQREREWGVECWVELNEEEIAFAPAPCCCRVCRESRERCQVLQHEMMKRRKRELRQEQNEALSKSRMLSKWIYIYIFFFSTMCCCRRYSALQEQTTSGSWTWQNEQTERLALRRRHTAWNTTTSTHSTVEKRMERREREKRKAIKSGMEMCHHLTFFFHLLTFPDYMNSWKHKCFM